MFNKTRTNFWVDATLLTLFVAVALIGLGLWFIWPGDQSGTDWLLLGLTRRILKEVHAWVGVTILVGTVIHLALHWRWVTCVAQRFWGKSSAQARLNFGLDSLLFAVFSTTSLSGLVMWLVLFGGGYRGGRNPLHHAALFGLTRSDWLDLHRWAGLLMLLIVGLHLILHWRWITCALRNYAPASKRHLTPICH